MPNRESGKHRRTRPAYGASSKMSANNDALEAVSFAAVETAAQAVADDWDHRCAETYWRTLAETAPGTSSPELRFDLRRTLRQLRAAFAPRAR